MSSGKNNNNGFTFPIYIFVTKSCYNEKGEIVGYDYKKRCTPIPQVKFPHKYGLDYFYDESNSNETMSCYTLKFKKQ